MTREENLKNLKRKLLERRSKVEALLFEMQELNRSFDGLKGLLANSKTINEVKDNLEVAKRFDDIVAGLERVNDGLEKLNKKPPPNIIVPNKVKVDNLPDKWRVDWESAPKIPSPKEVDVKTPIGWLQKSVEGLLGTLTDVLTGLASRISEYIRQPDKIIITDAQIIEFYGDKKVTYKINDGVNGKEISHEA